MLLNSSSVDVITSCPGSKKAIGDSHASCVSNATGQHPKKILPLPEDGKADEVHGTWLHAVAANLIIAFVMCLGLGDESFDSLLSQYKRNFGDAIEPVLPYVSACQSYIRAGYKQSPLAHCAVECKVDLSKYGFMPGVLDFVQYEIATHTLRIIDLKTGYRYVQTAGNLQLALYALGMADKWGACGYPVENVSLQVFQREQSWEWCPSVSQLQEIFKSSIRPAFHSSEFHSGDWCSFCPLKERCLERMRCELGSVLSIVQRQIDKGLSDVTQVTDAEIVALAESRKHLQAVMDSSRKEAVQRIREHGIPGYEEVMRRELVPGSDKQVIKRLKESGYNIGSGSDLYTVPKLSLQAIDNKTGGHFSTQQILGPLVRKVPTGRITRNSAPIKID